MHRTAPLVLAALCAPLAAAGDLNPPAGPVGPTMKTLDQVEPRTPLTQGSAPGDAFTLFRITQPGSYYLTGPITGESGKYGVIVSSAGEVTLDLNGFTLRGVPGTLDGIAVTVSNVSIRNGDIAGWDGYGIGDGQGYSYAIVENVRIRNCGQQGMQVGGGSVVRNCVSQGNVFNGFVVGRASTVENCTARENGNIGFVINDGSTIGRCASADNATHGFYIGAGGAITDCSARSNDTDGIYLLTGASATRCASSGNGGRGIRADNDCTVLENTLQNNDVGALGNGRFFIILAINNHQ